MSSKVIIGGGGTRKGNTGINDIPSGSRKIVQSLKEIVNSPEAEIYAMLKECNMDPNETVNRLLSQDPFHEVKSKKEKKKESKDIPDSRQRGGNNSYNRGGNRGGSDRFSGRSGSNHFNSTDAGNFQGKSANKRESRTQESQGYTSSWSSASGSANHHQTPHSDPVVTESKLPSVTSGDVISSSQPSATHQTSWFGAPGQRSMADIVKMGRPQNKMTKQNVSARPEPNHGNEASANQQVPVKDEWPSIETKAVAPPSTSSVSVAPAESEVYNGSADYQSDQHLTDRLENLHIAEDGPSETSGLDHVQSDSVAGGGVVHEDDSGGSSEYDDNPYNKYQSQSHPVDNHRDEDDVSSGSANVQQVNRDSHYQEASHEEDRPAVVIPDHLLIHTEECSQLSFGSFGGFGTRPLSSNNNVKETSDVAPPIEHSDARTTEFYGDDEHLGSTTNGNMVHAPATGSYDDSLESRQEALKQENSETPQEHQYNTFAHSEQAYAYENAKQHYDASQTNEQNQMQNIASLSNVMGYAQSVPNTLLAQNARELDFQYSAFPVAQSMQSRTSNNASSLGGQNVSMPEALRGSGIPATQPTQQTIPGANTATGPALPQQLPMHPYSQPAVPLAHFANMIGYPLMPQNYPYMPSAFQQGFPGNSSYHQQIAALLPQYKAAAANLSPSNLPQSATAPPASAYGFGNSTNVGSVTGNFPLSLQSAPTGTTQHSYEDVLSSQYRESHLLALQQQQQQQQQQNENSAMWHHAHGSRSVPANAYYNLQAQQQQQQQTQQGGYRQAQQQQQQHYGSHGYPNFYQSQTEMSLERQQQNPRDVGSGGGGGGGSQAGQQPSWQNSSY